MFPGRQISSGSDTESAMLVAWQALAVSSSGRLSRQYGSPISMSPRLRRLRFSNSIGSTPDPARSSAWRTRTSWFGPTCAPSTFRKRNWEGLVVPQASTIVW